MNFVFQRVKTAENTALLILGNFINTAVRTDEANEDTRKSVKTICMNHPVQILLLGYKKLVGI